jgi:hypothetical protein
MNLPGLGFAAMPWWAVLGVLLAALLLTLALYLLRRTPRRIVVSSVDLWKRAIERSRPKRLRSTTIPLLALLVSACVVSMLVVELGDPRLGRAYRGATVVVVAAGRSMGATVGGTAGLGGATRLDLARDAALAVVERASARGRVAVVRAGVTATVEAPLLDDASEARRALRSARFERADDGPADLMAAVAMADRIASTGGEGGRVVLVADRLVGIGTRVPLEVLPVGDARDTVAIVGLGARRDPVAVGEYAVRVELASFTSRIARAQLVVLDRDVVVAREDVRLPPYGRVVRTVGGFSQGRAEIQASLEEIEIAGSTDALAADDVAFAVAPALRRTRVLLVTQGAPALERAFAAHGGLDVTKATPGGLPDGDPHSRFDVIVLDRSAPEALLDHSGLLLIDPPSGAAGVRRGPTLRGRRITGTLAGHGALDGVRLDGARIPSARALVAEGDDVVLARAGGDALVTAREGSGKRRVVVGFDLERSDLVRRVAFPLFVHATMRWLEGREREDFVVARAPGAPLAVGAGQVVLGPAGEALTPLGETVVDTTRAGLYRVGSEAVAYSAAEAGEPLSAPPVAARRDPARFLPPLGLALAALLLLVLLVEWTLAHWGRLG